jgi:hypothetical protein
MFVLNLCGVSSSFTWSLHQVKDCCSLPTHVCNVISLFLLFLLVSFLPCNIPTSRSCLLCLIKISNILICFVIVHRSLIFAAYNLYQIIFNNRMQCTDYNIWVTFWRYSVWILFLSILREVTCTRGYSSGCKCGWWAVIPRTSVHNCNDWTNCQL